MRQFSAVLASFLLVLSGPAHAQEQAEPQTDTQSAEQQQAQKYYAEFQGMVIAYYVDTKCDVLDALSLQAALITQADRLDTLIEMGGATPDQLNDAMASMESQINAETCANLAELESFVASKKLTEFYRDFYLLLWDRYLLAANRHEAAGGDINDFACGSQPFPAIKSISALTTEARERLTLRDDFSNLEITATSQANDLREVCQLPAEQTTNLALLEYLTVAQAVVAESAGETAS